MVDGLGSTVRRMIENIKETNARVVVEEEWDKTAPSQAKGGDKGGDKVPPHVQDQIRYGGHPVWPVAACSDLILYIWRRNASTAPSRVVTRSRHMYKIRSATAGIRCGRWQHDRI